MLIPHRSNSRSLKEHFDMPYVKYSKLSAAALISITSKIIEKSGSIPIPIPIH
jgi:hypothetical protein